jgi:hypothetical protein
MRLEIRSVGRAGRRPHAVTAFALTVFASVNSRRTDFASPPNHQPAAGLAVRHGAYMVHRRSRISRHHLLKMAALLVCLCAHCDMRSSYGQRHKVEIETIRINRFWN